MAENKKISFNIDEDIHMRAKRLALDRRTSVTKLYNEWIKKELEKAEKEQKKLNDY